MVESNALTVEHDITAHCWALESLYRSYIKCIVVIDFKKSLRDVVRYALPVRVRGEKVAAFVRLLDKSDARREAGFRLFPSSVLSV